MHSIFTPHRHNNYLGKILNARVYEIAQETPLQFAPVLSSAVSNRVLLKREDLQPVFSFKIRGAYNKISQLSREQRAKVTQPLDKIARSRPVPRQLQSASRTCLTTLSPQPQGIVACSAGNHAQGVALSARELEIDAVIVMPVATPAIKVFALHFPSLFRSYCGLSAASHM